MFPTPVGMNRAWGNVTYGIRDVPHTRGDEPKNLALVLFLARMFPTPVGMNRQVRYTVALVQ